MNESELRDASLGDAVDFINTFGLTDGRPFDEFDTTADAVSWLSGRGLLGASVSGPGAAGSAGGWAQAAPPVIERVRDVRAAMREVFDATAERRTPHEAALATLNETLVRRAGIILVPRDDGIALTDRAPDDPLGDALARLVEPLAREAASPQAGRLRICANDGCRWVFRDASPNGRRRWCEMSSCGNRAKVARYRARHRAHSITEAPAPSGPASETPAS